MRDTRLRGARTNNLKSLDITIAPGTYLAVAGPSGSGKSSLAFGTLYAEGQRRYVESFSAYARQFLERLDRPPIDELDPVPAGISVGRQAPVRTSRSTVGTMTEIADYAKSLWSHAAELICADCGTSVMRDAPTRAAREVLTKVPDGARIVVTYPTTVGGAEEFLVVREQLIARGYSRVRTAEGVEDLADVPPSRVGLNLDVVTDRLVARDADVDRLVESLEVAMREGAGLASVHTATGETISFSEGLSCPGCRRAYRQASPGMFSFNHPLGACEKCRGFGRSITLDIDAMIPDRSLAINEGAVQPWRTKSTQWERKELKKHAASANIDLDTPLNTWSVEHLAWLIDGDGTGSPKGWWGIRGWYTWLESRQYKMHVRVFLARIRKYVECEDCHGSRLKQESTCWRIDGWSIADFFRAPVGDALRFLVERRERFDADTGVKVLYDETLARLTALMRVGLSYLTLDRQSRTLSGGETQRVALTSALGATLNGAMFVLDEPTVGLHPQDVHHLHSVVRDLARGDNIAIVVEHDHDMILGADRVIELGPEAGERGGEIVFDGSPAELRRATTLTARAIAARGTIQKSRRTPKEWIAIEHATGNNLRDVSVRFPVGAVTCVTGVSGSGKSSLVLQTLLPAVQRAMGERTENAPLAHEALHGVQHIKSALGVDQSPLGRTSRGNAATYLKAWEAFRKRLAQTPLAKERGYSAGYFSFNVEGGRCEACRGEGAETVEMQFLADVTFSCPECQGRRFSGDVLDVRLDGLNVAELLELTATEAAARFVGDKAVRTALQPMLDVGLGYLRLGQSLNTLSGGEAQRLKLAAALAGAEPGSLVVLDEPTAGLHSSDVEPLLRVIEAMADRGDTVIVVEHDMRLAAHADYVVEVGPGAGSDGGYVVAFGTPEVVAASRCASAPYLRAQLGLEVGVDSVPTEIDHAVAASESALSSPPPSAAEGVVIRGAREHNLQNISVQLPREKLVVVTGPSGSGKSTLAFDVLFAEGQRRYLETLSPYARQYMPQLPRPDVNQVIGVPPCVSLEQRVTRAGANSTVATVTEIAHYLRLIWARAGRLHCVDCGVAIAPRSSRQIAQDARAAFAKSSPVKLLSPVVRGRKGIHRDLLVKARKSGVERARIDGEWVSLSPAPKLDRYKEHDIELVVAELKVSDDAFESAIVDALKRGNGVISVYQGERSMLFSSKQACANCGRGYPELDPRFFSFNTRQGQCEACEGKGVIETEATTAPSKRTKKSAAHVAHTTSEECATCEGTRLSSLARSVTLADMRIEDVLTLSVTRAHARIETWAFDERTAAIVQAPVQEITRRLEFLDQVGLGYLGLDRAAGSLSGGEMQRVRLAAQLGSGLTGVLYILDEPTIGLHPRDTNQLVGSLRALVDRGNSVVVVEHDADMIRAADHVLDIGPGGGRNGGHVVGEGPLSSLGESSVTARSLRLALPRPAIRAIDKSTSRIQLKGATHHNLKRASMGIPVGRLTTVTGVSGSGKSSLVREVFLRAVRDELGLVNDAATGAYDKLLGATVIKRAVEVDQSPIGRTPRSVPATYLGVWDTIRLMLAGTPTARARGYSASRFSFNVAEGRCPDCNGHGSIRLEMAFLADVDIPCESCRGMRFTPETLQVQWHERHAGELLHLEVREAVEVFASVSKVCEPLKLLDELGLGYLQLGQPSNTLSGGEAQRVKLAAELAVGANAGPTLYVLDEPTTGLHRGDVERLLNVMHKLVDRGDTVVVIEHHPDVMVHSDWLIDLGPEGGEGGGQVIAEGTPEAIADLRDSHTGRVVSQQLGYRAARTRSTKRSNK